MSQLLLALVISCHSSFVIGNVLQSSLCAPGRLDVGGVELVERNRGRILLTVRMGLQCHDCHKHLREYSLMVTSISDLSVAILVPDNEHPSAVRHSQLEFPKLQILHDTQRSTTHWPEGQQILFDRCGRISKSIRESVPFYHEALEAVRQAVSHAQCGWCQYDTRGARDLSKRQFDAYIRNERRNSRERGENSRREDYRQQEQRYRQDNDHSQAYSYHQPSYQQTQQEQRYQPQYHQIYQQPPQHVNYDQRSSPSRHPQEQYQYQQSPELKRDNWGDFWTTTTTTPRPIKKLHYSEDSDYGDYMNDVIATTARTETQIPKPQNPNAWWPTPPPTTMDYRLMMGADVPCAAYTDDICFMQQEKLGRGSKLPKCCSKGIYLTDLCVPGKCSNSTTQLCCLQKFLQAKYACCEDETQSDGTSTTNKFSQCCYSKFAAKSECCTPERADDYWSSIHELCYPNTKVDLSTVKLEVRFAEGMRVIDLGENRVWDYECQHGGNRLQLAYFP